MSHVIIISLFNDCLKFENRFEKFLAGLEKLSNDDDATALYFLSTFSCPCFGDKEPESEREM
jgi:hypothetical protein